MIVTLDEMKQYLRVDYPDDDGILTELLSAAQSSAWMWLAQMMPLHLPRLKTPRSPSCMLQPICMSTGRKLTTTH